MKSLCLCLLGITVFVQVVLRTLANPDGFININCGASDDETGGSDDLRWISDFPFYKGESRPNCTLSDNNLYLPYRSLSYFKDRSQKKYCYLLNVSSDTRYLVRTIFNYGSESKSNCSLASVFDLLIEGVWTTVNLTLDDYYFSSYEIILGTKSDQLSLCLARNPQTDGNVFISTIELRPLDRSMYAIDNTGFGNKALLKKYRLNIGGESISYRAYNGTYSGNKSDPYDRIWHSYKPEGDAVNTTLHLGTEKEVPNLVPQKVLQTAVLATEIEDMDISDAFDSLSSGSYYFLFYFCNINCKATSFQVHINEQHSTDWIDFDDQVLCKQIDKYFDLSTDTDTSVVLTPSNHAASGPFINGAELYQILSVHSTHPEDVLAIREIVESEGINVPDDWSGGDPCLPSNYSATGITCSTESPPRVIIINLTNMGLVGDIPPSIAKLTALTELLLGNNSLSGPVPDLSPLKNLTTLQLQNNQLEGSIPTSLAKLSSLNQLYLQNNGFTGTVPRGLLKHGLDLQVDPQNKSSAHKRKRWPMEISVGCSVLLVLVVIGTALLWRHRHRSQTYIKDRPTYKKQHASAEDQSEFRTLPIEYTEEDIEAATKNYSKVIGKGSFGSVFYGRFAGSDVAVKVLSTDSNQGQLEFHNELTVLSRIRHKNLVNLVGYCRQPVVALVYEYMECGSLKDHLYGIAKLEKPLDWHTRLNIALQAAEGLLYLHHGCNPPIIHRDIKCNNILLDGSMCAKVTDFGLSKVLESSKSYVSTIVKGTIGYLDPEYFETSALTEKSDVYSFGVVLLEIISGKSPKDGIVESGRELLSCGRMADLVDTSLGGRYNLASAWRVAEIAYACTKPKPINRPTMSVVVKELQEAAALPEEDVNLYGGLSITTSIQRDLPRVR